MKWVASFLTLLLGSAQVDDAWTFAAAVQSVQLPSDNDDYLPSQKQTEESAPHREPVLVASNPRTADFSLVRWAVPAEWRLAAPFTDSLYVFMSLQI
jgi:hypothetical protein